MIFFFYPEKLHGGFSPCFGSPVSAVPHSIVAGEAFVFYIHIIFIQNPRYILKMKGLVLHSKPFVSLF